MAKNLRKHWQASLVEGISRRERKGCSYEAYLPDMLSGWNFTLGSALAADIADAEMAVHDLNATGTSHVSLEGLARFLLRAESVASSKIEGIGVAPQRLMRAEIAMAQGSGIPDHVAVEILGNVAAMETAIDMAARRDEFSRDNLLQIHRQLMDRSSRPDFGGVIRTEQNWIGGNSYNPCNASFVPPPPEYLDGLIDDLIGYINSDDHSPVVQAAITHAQFETIHPFYDGNGRVGRALIHVVLRRRELAPTFVPPISLTLATWASTYVAGLMAYRHNSPPASNDRSLAAQTWLETFATATRKSCGDAQGFAANIDTLNSKWRQRIGRIRKDSATERLLAILPGAPVITVDSAAKLIDRSAVNTGAAISRLTEVGILSQRNIGKQRYRIFEATEVVQLFTALEQALSTSSLQVGGLG